MTLLYSTLFYRRRKDNLSQAKLHLAHGRSQQARDFFVKCVDVTPVMALEFIKALRAAGVDYIVAPYEADAQLAYLERRGTIQGLITEDSDLLVFGCKTVLYKLNDQGRCIELLQHNRNKCKSLQLGTFTDAHFRQMAILSGCDYLDSIPGEQRKRNTSEVCETDSRYGLFRYGTKDGTPTAKAMWFRC
jgi:exonuclease-1